MHSLLDGTRPRRRRPLPELRRARATTRPGSGTRHDRRAVHRGRGARASSPASYPERRGRAAGRVRAPAEPLHAARRQVPHERPRGHHPAVPEPAVRGETSEPAGFGDAGGQRPTRSGSEFATPRRDTAAVDVDVALRPDSLSNAARVRRSRCEPAKGPELDFLHLMLPHQPCRMPARRNVRVWSSDRVADVDVDRRSGSWQCRQYSTLPGPAGFRAALAGQASAGDGTGVEQLYELGQYGGLIGRPAAPLVKRRRPRAPGDDRRPGAVPARRPGGVVDPLGTRRRSRRPGTSSRCRSPSASTA